MTLRIFNNLKKKIEEFKPIKNNKVNIYVCGMTVHSDCHIGHGRTFLVFDTIVRYLKYCGFKVKYIRNITDISEKIISKSYESKEDYKILTKKIINNMHQDLDKLNILKPTYEPLSTDHIKEIIKVIEILIIKHHAYISKNGDVMFSTASFKEYGMLSNQNFKRLKLNRNILNFNSKHEKHDFVLWKLSNKLPSWKSPWGNGRPGWHIECSVMSNLYLNNNIDIHGGGIDLVFPHHENEIAQSKCIYNNVINFWMHVGLVFSNNKKISKSSNNCLILRDIFKKFNYESIRFFLLSKHYRKQLVYNENNLKNANYAVEKLYVSLLNTNFKVSPYGGDKFIHQFKEAMDNDFNVPKAYKVLFDISKQVNYLKVVDQEAANGMAATLCKLGNILGLLEQNPIYFLRNSNNINYILIDNLIKKRNEARRLKNWKIADSIRLEILKKFDVKLEDYKYGTIWRKNKL